MVIIEFLKKESISKILNFFNSAQSDKIQKNNRSQHEFEWLFLNSFFKPAIYTVASDSESGVIIGTFAGIYIPMTSKNGEQILTVKGEDTLISLDEMIKLGKRDILNELLLTIVEKSREDNAKFMWGFTPAKAAFKRCGFKIITKVKGSFYVTNPLKFYENRIRLFPNLTLIKKTQLYVFSWYNYLGIRLKFIYPGEFYSKRITFDEIDEKVLLSFLPENVCTTFLSKDFLRWRIKENPSSLTYGFLEFRDKRNVIVAFFIFSSNNEKIFFVEQFLFDRQLSDNGKFQIMRLAFKYCAEQKAIMIRAIGLSHNKLNNNEMRLMSKSGFHFFDNPDESYFVFRNFSDSDINPEDVYLSRLNTMGLR